MRLSHDKYYPMPCKADPGQSWQFTLLLQAGTRCSVSHGLGENIRAFVHGATDNNLHICILAVVDFGERD